MTIRRIVSILCRAAVGIGSLLVSMYGVYSFDGMTLAPDTVAVVLFGLLPVLFFPVWILSFWRLRLAVILHWAFAAGYLVVYSILDRRTCSEMGYCGSVLSTVIETLTAHPVEATFAVAMLNLAAWRLAGKRRSVGVRT
jgi:hypothetical protein